MIRNLTPEDYEELVEALRSARQRIPLSDEQIAALAQRARIREGLRGEVVMRQGEEANELYFVISGQLRAYDVSGDKPRLLNYHAAKTFVGEQGMLYGRPRAATVDVVSDAKLAFWDQATFDWLLELNNQVRPYFEELYRGRVGRARQSFPGQRWDEVVLVHTGKHPLTLLNALMAPALLLLFSLGLLVFLLMVGEVSSTFIGVAVGLPGGISLLWGAYNYADWANDEYIVTSERVIHIERVLLYGEKRDEAPLIRIQDITVVARTWLQRVLNYHDLTIKTAGAGDIVFAGLTDAFEVQERIFEGRGRALERREAEDRASIRRALAQRMGMPTLDIELPVDTLAPTSDDSTQKKATWLPPLLDYLWPRMWMTEGDTITWRKHWIILLEKTWPALLLTLALSSLTILALLDKLPFETEGQDVWVVAILLGLGTLVAFGWYVYCYDDWHRDVYLVTTDRIVDVESSAFRLHGEERREGTFDVIQNITYDIPGFFNTLLNMGTVTIESAGTAGTFAFERVFDPSAVQQEIFNRAVAFQEERRRQERVREGIKMGDWFGEYNYLHLAGGHDTHQVAPE